MSLVCLVGSGRTEREDPEGGFPLGGGAYSTPHIRGPPSSSFRKAIVLSHESKAAFAAPSGVPPNPSQTLMVGR